jgi:hypothetical protein
MSRPMKKKARRSVARKAAPAPVATAPEIVLSGESMPT